MKREAVYLLVALLAASTAQAAVSYSGSLTGVSANPIPINGTGFWVDQSALPANQQALWTPVQLDWTVSQNVDSSWHYDYTLSVYRADVSHFIIETSTNFTSSDIFNATGFDSKSIGLNSHTNPGNPFMPADLYGIKFDMGSYGDTTINIEFDSWRSPVWGDFYAKCGNVGGTQNTAWNYTFTDADPTDPPADNSNNYHILVPDSVPEPATIGLLGLGLIGLLRRKRA